MRAVLLSVYSISPVPNRPTPPRKRPTTGSNLNGNGVPWVQPSTTPRAKPLILSGLAVALIGYVLRIRSPGRDHLATCFFGGNQRRTLRQSIREFFSLLIGERGRG